MQRRIGSYEDHWGFATDFLREAHGVLARSIVTRLVAVGSSTLKDLADYLRLKDPFSDEAVDIFGKGSLGGSGVGGGGGGSAVGGGGGGGASVLHTPQVSAANTIAGATDRDIKVAMATLVQHGIVTYSEAHKVYAPCLGPALLLALQPALVRHVRAELGDGGDIVFSMFAKYGRLTLAAVEREAARAAPSVADAIRTAAVDMRFRGYLVSLSAAPSSSGSNTATAGSSSLPSTAGAMTEGPSEKRRRMEAASLAADTSVYTIGFAALLAAMRAKVLKAFVAERYDTVRAAVLAAMIDLDAGNCGSGGGSGASGGGGVPPATSGFTASTFPALPCLSRGVSLNDVQRHIGGGAPLPPAAAAALSAAVATLACDELGGVIQRASAPHAHSSSSTSGPYAAVHRGGSSSSGDSGNAHYAVHYGRLVGLMRTIITDRVVFARYGTVGHRAVQLLRAQEALEDRHIAEQAVCLLTHVREALLGLAQDGYVRQLDIPKSHMDPNAERNPKNSTFVWTLEPAVLEARVRRHLVRAARNANARLQVELHRLTERFPAACATLGAHTMLHSVPVGPLPTTTTAGSSGIDIGGAAFTNTSSAGGAASSSGTSSPASPTAPAMLLAMAQQLSPAEQEALLKIRFACRALQTTLVAQSDCILVMDFF